MVQQRVTRRRRNFGLHRKNALHRLCRRSVGALVSAALLIGGITALLVTVAPESFADPSPAPADAGQIISVNALTATSTTGTLTGWARGSDGSWRVAIGPVSAFVGEQGIGQASEMSGRTPAGAYPLTQGFGRQLNPGTGIHYFQTDPLDWWDENPLSRTYNLHVRQSASPGGNSENLYSSGSVYDYAVNMDYNMGRAPGAGSAFFLHVADGKPTAGCVSVPKTTMIAILRWLDPAQHPYIYNKLGAAWKPPAPTSPTGKVEVLAPIGSKQINVAGWAVDPAAPRATLTIRVRVYGPQGASSTEDTTRLARPDITRSFWWAGPTSGFHIHVAGTIGLKTVCVDEVVTATGAAKTMMCRRVVFR